MAGKKRSSADFPNITRSESAKILEKARKTRYVTVAEGNNGIHITYGKVTSLVKSVTSIEVFFAFHNNR